MSTTGRAITAMSSLTSYDRFVSALTGTPDGWFFVNIENRYLFTIAKVTAPRSPRCGAFYLKCKDATNPRRRITRILDDPHHSSGVTLWFHDIETAKSRLYAWFLELCHPLTSSR